MYLCTKFVHEGFVSHDCFGVHEVGYKQKDIYYGVFLSFFLEFSVYIGHLFSDFVHRDFWELLRSDVNRD